jgi:hypothetical protein
MKYYVRNVDISLIKVFSQPLRTEYDKIAIAEQLRPDTDKRADNMISSRSDIASYLVTNQALL